MVGVKKILGLALVVTQIFAFLDTNMLVSLMQNSGAGGVDQHKAPMQKKTSQWNIGFRITYISMLVLL